MKQQLQERIFIVVPSVQSLFLHQTFSGFIWEVIQRDASGVQCVINPSGIHQGSVFMPEFIQERNHSVVLSVQSLLHNLTSWKYIQEVIQRRNHLVVLFAQSLLHGLTIWKHIQEFIQERNHSAVLYVRSPLVIPQLSGNTQEFIIGRTPQLYSKHKILS